MKRLVMVGNAATAALAGLLFGFDTAVIAGVTGALREIFELSPAALGITVSAALWGTLAGALFAGAPGDRYGSRDGLRVMAILYAISGIGSALAWNWESLVIFRFIGGLAIGGSSVLAPVYITEMAPPERRGALVGLFQLNIVIGILVAYLSNYLLSGVEFEAAEWRWKLGATTLPSIVFFALLSGLPHSPRWLVSRGRTAEARTVLARIGADDRDVQLSAIERSMRTKPGEIQQRLSWSAHRKPILLAVSVALFNQLAGINAILYYLNDIFAAAGHGDVSSNLQAIVIGATNLLFTVLALLVIDRVGRRTLLLAGSIGMACSLFLVAIVMFGRLDESLLIYLLIGFIACFAFSQGAVIWVYISEIFPTQVRARGQSLGSSTHWLMNALISGLFPVVAAYSKGAPFLFFAAMMVLQFLVVLRFFPETKRLALEDMHSS